MCDAATVVKRRPAPGALFFCLRVPRLPEIPMFKSASRSFIHALMLSLAVHAALLLSVVGELPAMPEVPSARIKAVLAERSVAKPLPVLVPKSPALPIKPRPLSMPDLAFRSPVVPTPAAPADSVPPSPSAPAERAADSPVPSAATSTGTPLREGASADELRQYRLSLAIAARRFKRYPALARERGWEGTVDVAIVVNALLPTPEVNLIHSSGHAALDEQALEMIGQAARLTALPGNLQGRNFRLLLPVQFSLEGDQ